MQKGLFTAEEKGNALLRIQPVLELDEGVHEADIIIEAATENESVKLQIFRDLDELAAPAAILASNTSSISITKIGAATKRPGQVIGMHWIFGIVKIVPVVSIYWARDCEFSIFWWILRCYDIADQYDSQSQ